MSKPPCVEQGGFSLRLSPTASAAAAVAVFDVIIGIAVVIAGGVAVAAGGAAAARKICKGRPVAAVCVILIAAVRNHRIVLSVAAASASHINQLHKNLYHILCSIRPKGF